MEFVDNHCKAAPCAGNRRIMTKYGRGYSLCCSRRSERTAQLLQGSYACRQYAIQQKRYLPNNRSRGWHLTANGIAAMELPFYQSRPCGSVNRYFLHGILYYRVSLQCENSTHTRTF